MKYSRKDAKAQRNSPLRLCENIFLTNACAQTIQFVAIFLNNAIFSGVISKMSTHSFSIKQRIPIPVRDAWNFFSKPSNLQLITPASFQFKILSTSDDRPIYEGQIIDYTVRPLFNIRMRWTTLITRVEEEVMFIDEQKRGPYRYWQHQHCFRPIADGTEMSDIVRYEIPGWWAGDVLNTLLVKSDLKKLFLYRSARIEQLFGKDGARSAEKIT